MMTLKEWCATQTERDVIRQSVLANEWPVTGETLGTVTDTVTRPASLVSAELDHIALVTQLGLNPATATVSDLEAELLALSATDEATATALSDRMILSRIMMVEARSEAGLAPYPYADPHFGQASYDVERTVIERVYGESPAQVNGWGVVTPEMIMECQR